MHIRAIHKTDPPSSTTELRITFKTMAKLGIGILLAYGAHRLWPLLLLLLLASLLAVTLQPILKWLQRRGLPRWGGLGLIILALLSSFIVFFAIIIPSIVNQVADVATAIPQLKTSILNRVSPHNLLQPILNEVLKSPYLAGPEPWMKHLPSGGQYLLGGFSAMVLLLIFAVYLLIDGPRTYRWLIAFFAPAIHQKIHETTREVSKVVSAFVTAQFITSTLVFIYSFVMLQSLHVPAALTLAILVGLFDVLPMIGFFMAAAPAILLALTVSPRTAGTVALLYVLYHFIETYLIGPRISGRKLRLSTLTVLVSLAVGELLFGFVGAIAILPIVATYPIIERIWLTHVLRHSTLRRHAMNSLPPG